MTIKSSGNWTRVDWAKEREETERRIAEQKRLEASVGHERVFSPDVSISVLEFQLELAKQLLDERQRLLDAIPQCPAHGECVPYALEWIAKAKVLMATKEPERETA
jgi:hypothetical protein